jgi:hypothetical protein
MSAKIHVATQQQMRSIVVAAADESWTPEQLKLFCRYVDSSPHLWLLSVNNEIIYIWGVIPTSFVSGTGYLWSYAVGDVAGNEFVFVRQSQIAIRDMLETYSILSGHTDADNEKGKRWLKWLGAEFGPPNGRLVPFTIRRG